MPKPSSGSNRYLKAQLRPLTKPVFWASAGLFGLSLFALASLFRQPDEALSNGDRDAVVNLDENDSLTPEERARAAEIDDLSVLLKDLDKSKTIDSVSGRLNDAQTQNLEAPKAIADLDTSQATSSVPSNSSDFQQLPLLDLSPQSPANSTTTQTGSSGFIGFDPRSSGQVGGNSTSLATVTTTPLSAALDRDPALSAATFSDNASSVPGLNNSINPTTANPSGQRTGALSNGVQPNGSPIYTNPTSIAPTLTAPNYGNSQGLVPQNSSNNAYSQILNPNLVVPTTPLSPVPMSPGSPAQPASTVVSPLGQLQINPHNSGATMPASTPQTQPPVFGAPSSQVTAPTLNNPAPYSIPNRTPAQHSGNGKINTFANP